MIFWLGVLTWLYGKFKDCGVVDFWVYKYSRQPQYLGYLLWSYGLLLFVEFGSYVFGAFKTPPTIIWLVSAMIIVGVALHEEKKMEEKYGEKYERYWDRVPFMLPMPRTLSKLITLPSRLVNGRRPMSGRSIAAVLIVYTIVLVALSGLSMMLLEIQ